MRYSINAKRKSVEKYISIKPGTLQREGYSKKSLLFWRRSISLSARQQMQRQQDQCLIYYDYNICLWKVDVTEDIILDKLFSSCIGLCKSNILNLSGNRPAVNANLSAQV